MPLEHDLESNHMSINHSPKIVTDDLLFYYDQENTRRSWYGKPTTNYIPYPYASYNNGSFVLGYNYANLGATYTYRTGVDNPINAPGVFEYYTGTSGYKYFSIDTTVVPTTGTYTFSYYARIISGSSVPNNLNNSQLWRANGVDQSVTGDWNPNITSEWTRFSTQGPITAGTILQYFPIHSGNLTGDYTIQYCGFQLELNEFATPFVNGTRTSTNALLDLTAQNTITMTQLTYTSDGKFSFGGQGEYDGSPTGDYITIPTALTSTSPSVKSNGCTYSWWSKITAAQPFGQCILFGASTIAHIEFKNEGTTSPYFRTEAAIENGKSFGSGTIPGGSLVGRWANFTIVFANNEAGRPVRWYHNGELFHTGSMTGGTSPDTEYFYFSNIGRSTGTADFLYSNSFYGEIPVFQIYNRSLTEQEVLQNFNALRGRFSL